MRSPMPWHLHAALLLLPAPGAADTAHSVHGHGCALKYLLPCHACPELIPTPASLLRPSCSVDKAQFKMGKMARKGEADRHIPDLKPKHLFSGKRPRGTTDRR